MTKTRMVQPWRRLGEALQAVLIIGLPFIRVHGESALRFDIPFLRLHFFGVSLLMDEFFLVLVALIFITFLVILVTVMFGRIWCGWLCPQTVLVDATRFLDRLHTQHAGRRVLLYALTFLISLMVSASLIWYFVSPYEFISRLVKGTLGTLISGFWGVMSVIIFLNLVFLRHKFCATVCPYAKLQSVLFDRGTLVIAFDPRRKEECLNCRACVRTCPVGIDIRDGLSPACINCAECLDTCTAMMGRLKKKGLISYFFGEPGSSPPFVRQTTVMAGSLTVFFFFFLLYLSLSRMPFDMTILPNNDYPPRISADNQGINSFLLFFQNRQKGDVSVRLTARRSHGAIRIVPERVLLTAGEHKKIPVYVLVNTISLKQPSEIIEISAESDSPRRAVRKDAHFTLRGL